MEEATKKGNRWIVVPVVEDLKKKAKAQGLWNMFLPHSEHGAGLSNLEYSPLAEMFRTQYWASRRKFSIAPRPIPATWEVLDALWQPLSAGQQWLTPLLRGRKSVPHIS